MDWYALYFQRAYPIRYTASEIHVTRKVARQHVDLELNSYKWSQKNHYETFLDVLRGVMDAIQTPRRVYAVTLIPHCIASLLESSGDKPIPSISTKTGFYESKESE